MALVPEEEPLHVFNLPQLHSRPSAPQLRDALDLLATKPSSWGAENGLASPVQRSIDPVGVTGYLTSIVASALAWLDESERVAIWELASQRLSERSGRSAQSALTRTFDIAVNTSSTVPIIIHEPALTSDNLGLKTWCAAYLLSRRLCTISPIRSHRVLELGAGTGLVGIAAAIVWGSAVHLTDLPEIVPNLAANIEANLVMIAGSGGSASAGVLDWGDVEAPVDRFGTIVVADPIYSPEHPRLLVQAVGKCLSRQQDARLLIELPLRDEYIREIAELKGRMQQLGLAIKDEGEEVGRDDWGPINALTEVRCWYARYEWACSSYSSSDR